ncbi:hypothetical protein NHN08_06570 [Riemerella anatipestifer]|uniref:hypothetical protein n=1 Tax=Riemerella anatipestifer TaxID=34085 RepID=UPI0020978E32|nr:hypothetical protein [Riemerella anatipestifer]MCO7332163.1 hypothetical protein [Riemerella anatipestifer]MCO7351004.1 hypothetical protein [Riemerella anatipestifer]
MKKNLLTLCVVAATMLPATALAQQEVENLTVRKGNELSREYLRPSMSSLYFTDGSYEANQIVKYLQQINSEQYDVNRLEKTISEGDLSSRELVDVVLDSWKVGNQIMGNWFPEFINEQEGYSLKVLEGRGKYAATDADVLRSEASHRKSILNNLGEKLIDRSYVKVYYLYEGKAKLEDIVLSEKKKKVGVKTYVYKLNFNDEVRTNFYENYFNQLDGVQKATFPLTFVLENENNISISEDDRGREDYAATAEKIFSRIDNELSSKVNDFKVQTAVIETSPIRAKIGYKEGLRIDDRYDVMELVLDSEGKEVAKRKAVVRVDSYIADNRSEATGGTTDMTKFYKFLGGRVQEGMTLVKKGEVGTSVIPYASLSGVGLMLDYRTKWYPGLFVYLKGDLPVGKDYVTGKQEINKAYSKFTISGDNITVDKKDAHTIFRLGLGVMKEFYFARNLVVGAGVGAGRLFATESENKQKLDFKVLYGEAIGRFGIQFSPNFQLFAQADYNYYFGDGVEYSIGYGKTVKLYDGEYFNKQLNKLGIGVGAKISF